MTPGEVFPGDGPVPLNPGRHRIAVTVTNTGDRPIQVGSHYHFAATNPALEFDRPGARGCRLDVPAGTGTRFEPGLTRTVTLVPLAGRRIVPGLRPEHAGPLGPAAGGTAAGGTAAGGTRPASSPRSGESEA